MRFYRWSEKGEGRLVGRAGRLCIYERVLTECRIEERPKRVEDRKYGEFKFVYGPSTGGLLESIRFNVVTDGERIVNIDAEVYKVRKVKLTGMGVEDALLRVERVNAPFAASHALSFILAVEDVLGVEPDYQTQLKRIAELELERVRNHMFVISRLTEMASLSVPTYHLLALVEEANRLVGELCGHRYFFGVNGINSVNCDFSGGKLLKVVDIAKEFRGIFEGLLGSRIFIDRLQDNGKVFDERSIGPAARASGLAYDARGDADFLPYKDVGFRAVKEDGGDAFARFLVRGYEVFESVRMLVEVNDMLRDERGRGEVVALGDGEGLARLESPSGDIAYYVRLSKGVVEEVHYFFPSFSNLNLFLESSKGTIFTDFPFNWESFGIWASELGAEIE